MFKHSIIINILLSLSLCSLSAWADESESHAPAVTVSGVVEVELGFASDNVAKDPNDPSIKDKTYTDIVTATVELGFDAQITDWIAGHVLFLWEEDDTELLAMDEATITIANEEKSPWSFSFGKMYVPFGSFESNMVSDPLTLEIGEINESAINIGFNKGVYGNFYLFNGDIQEADTVAKDEGDQIESFGLRVGYGMENDNMAIDVGVDYISNIADTDTMQDVVDPDNLKSFVAGLGVHANLTFGRVTLIGEYLGAMDEFNENELFTNTKKRQPTAYNAEIGIKLGEMTTLAFGYQGTSDSLEVGLPETRLLAAVGLDVAENTGLSFELAVDEDYSLTDGGDGETDITFVAQLAVEF